MEINARVLSVPLDPDSKRPMILKVLETSSDVVTETVLPVFTPIFAPIQYPK